MTQEVFISETTLKRKRKSRPKFIIRRNKSKVETSFDLWRNLPTFAQFRNSLVSQPALIFIALVNEEWENIPDALILTSSVGSMPGLNQACVDAEVRRTRILTF